MEHTITEGVSVFVLNGKHKGWGGNVVYTTPKKLRLRRNDGTESGLVSLQINWTVEIKVYEKICASNLDLDR
eukprot:m.18669 g.18669  ORF g.18669 m.18669 type:complete len:72 (+) comp6379_c0_seq1:112-327(+)